MSSTSSCGSPPSGSACARRRCAARGPRGRRPLQRRMRRTRRARRRCSSSSWRRTRRWPSAWLRAASSPSSSTPNGAGPPRCWRAVRKRTAWPSYDRGAAVARPDRAPAADELPVEVDDEELDDAEPTAVEDGDGTPAAESAEENGGPPRTTDPVRLYLREAGAIQLLTREGEVEIAKRIEESNRLLVRAVLGTPHALRYVLALAEPLRAGEVRVRDLVADEGEEDAETEPAAEDLRLRRRFLAQLGRVRRLVAARDALARGLLDRRREHARLAQARARLEARLLGALCGLGLSRRQIERVASGLYAGVERVGRRRAQLQAVERRTGRSAAELLRMTRGLARGGESGEPSRPERAALEHACRELRVPHETLVA